MTLLSEKMLQLQCFADPAEFRRQALPFLIKNEAMNCLPLRIAGGLSPERMDRVFLSIIHDRGDVQAIALQTPPHTLVLSEPCSPAACERLLAEDAVQKMPGVIGPSEVAETFAACWQKRTKGTWSVAMSIGAYALTHLKNEAPAAGRLRQAEEADLTLATLWIKAFHEEAVPHSPAGGKVDLHGYYFWETEGVPVCGLRALPSTPRGAVINEVYTPPEYRKRGFATSAVAAATARMLAAGCKFSFLFTDLANSTSNTIYRRIGYQQVGEFRQIRFQALPCPA